MNVPRSEGVTHNNNVNSRHVRVARFVGQDMVEVLYALTTRIARVDVQRVCTVGHLRAQKTASKMQDTT